MERKTNRIHYYPTSSQGERAERTRYTVMRGTYRILFDTNALASARQLVVGNDGKLNYPQDNVERLPYVIYGGNIAAISSEIYPEDIKPVVDYRPYIQEVSWFGFIPNKPSRDMGEYEFAGAKMFVDGSIDKPNLLMVRIISPNEQGIKVIYEKLREGKIHPRPGKNWSLSQKPLKRLLDWMMRF